MKKYMIRKYNVQGANKRKENAERENLSILYVCLTDDKFIRMAKSTFYVPEVMTSETEKYTALKNNEKVEERWIYCKIPNLKY